MSRGSEGLQTVREIMDLSVGWLKKKGATEPRLSVELLLARALGLRRLDLYLNFDRPLVAEELEGFRELLRRRGRREPLSYILGEREFHELSFKVGPGVLVPRPETELLVDFALERLAPKEPVAEDAAPLRWVDVGTGSGCIAISLARHATRPQRGCATEISPEALAIARENAERLQAGDALTFYEGDLLEPIPAEERFELILSNPPYISEAERPALEAEVSDFEPAGALFDAAEDGLGTTRRLAEQARERLAPGGAIAVELGAGRAKAARAAFEALGYEAITVIRDYGGHERVLHAVWPG